MYLGHPALHYGQAFLTVMNVLAGVRARRSIGTGQGSDASLLDAFLAQSPMNHWWQEDGISYIKKGDSGAIDRFGNVRLVTGMFECGDGKFLQIHTGSDGFKPAFDILGFGDRIKKVPGLEMAVPLSEDEYQAARVDEHIAEVLREVGFSDDEIAGLVERRVAIQPADVTSRIDSKVNA